jgi:hypothetical protein
MSLLIWVLLFALLMLFWCWVIFWGGADWLEESGFSVLLFWSYWWREDVSARLIRFYAWLSLIGTVIWFVAGLVNPKARFWY